MNVFEPITIRGMTIKNRIIMAPIGTNYPLRNAQSKDFYLERAKGGVGAITLGGTNVDAFFSDRFTDGVREWVIDPVHKYGVKIGPELWHGNLYPTLPFKEGMQQWVAPSAGSPLGALHLAPLLRAPAECYCRELSIPEIQDIITRFARAAAKIKSMGFDYIHIHAAHGHNLLDQFFSPRDNRRTDIYGGNLAGRMRFGIEVTMAIRSAIGDFPFFWRLSAEHGLPGGHTLNESVQYGTELVTAGVDVIDVSYGHEEVYEAAPNRSISVCLNGDEPMGTFSSSYAQAFKRRLSVPVIAVGRINHLKVAEEILSQGKADMINVGRQLLADTYWPQKIASGALEDINPCLACNECILTFREERAPIKCAVNASLGKEAEYQIKPAEKAKKVLVVGGGPAGMEAARVAAQRGHNVTLVDKGSRLGGLLLLQEKLPHKPITGDLIEYYTHQLKKAGVQVRLNEEISANSIEEMKPDVTIIATGSNPILPDVPGLEKHNNTVTANDILSGRKDAGDIVTIIGGGSVACDTAVFLADKGKGVVMVEILDSIAAESYVAERKAIGYRLATNGVTVLIGVKQEEGTAKGLTIIDRYGRPCSIEADTIVIAAGATPNDELTKLLKDKVQELYSIGDCVKPRKIINAIADGANISCQI